MIFAKKNPDELFRINKGGHIFHIVRKADISPTSITKEAIEADIRTAANLAFPIAAQGWHFYINIPQEQISNLEQYQIWAGPKYMKPEANWWEFK